MTHSGASEFSVVDDLKSSVHGDPVEKRRKVLKNDLDAFDAVLSSIEKSDTIPK